MEVWPFKGRTHFWTETRPLFVARQLLLMRSQRLFLRLRRLHADRPPLDQHSLFHLSVDHETAARAVHSARDG